MKHGEFIDACAEQGVRLLGSLAHRGVEQIDLGPLLSDDLLRGAPLAEGPQIDDSFCRGNVERTLVDLINTSRQPDTDCPLQIALATGARSVRSCPDAESRFEGWLRGLESHRSVGGRIVIDGMGKAVLAQKSRAYSKQGFGEPSSLLLQPVAVAGVRLPAGSIINTVFEKNGQAERETFGRPPIVALGQIVGAAFLRLSGFVLPKENC